MTTAPVPQIGPAEKPATDKPTTSDVLETFTGFDELAVEKAFGADIETIMRTKGLTYLRALAFVQELHDGAKHDDAKKTALSLTIRDLNDRFAEEDDDELPGSEAGKDGT